VSFEEEPDGELFDSRNRGMSYYVYNVCGWGITSDCTFVVSVDESLD